MSAPRRGRRRQEGVEKVTGRTRFTADLELPGLLHVQLVVSQLASAGIKGIDAEAARSMPGVVDAAAAVVVDYDETPPVVDPEAAMRDDSPLVLDEDEQASDEDASIHGGSTATEEA